MATVSKSDITKKDDGTVSVGVVLDPDSAQSLVEFKNYLHRVGSFLNASVTSFNNAFKRLDEILKTTGTDAPFTDLKVSDITANIKETEDVTEKSSRSIEDSNNKIEDSNKKVEKSFKLVDYAAVSVFRKVLRYSVRIYKSLTSAGSNMIETNTRFNRILGDLADQAEGYATAISNAYAITRTEAKTAITKVYQLANASGLGAKNALELAKGVTILGSELASVWDTSTEQSVNALISALQGLPKAAKGYSLYLNTEQIKNTLAEAGYVVKGTLTQQEKIFGTYLKMLKDAGYSIGDFASTQTSMANQMKLLNASITTLKEELGSMLNTVMSPIFQVINKIAKFLIFIVNGLNELPDPIRFIIGSVMALIIGISVLSVTMILSARVMQIFKNQVDKVSASLLAKLKITAADAALIKNVYLPVIGKTLLTFVLIAFAVGSLVKLIEKLNDVQKENTDINENNTKAIDESARALANYDDVNTLTFNNQSNAIDFSDWSNINEMFKDIMGTNNDLLDSLDDVGNKYIWLYGIMFGASAIAGIASLVKNWGAIVTTVKLLGSGLLSIIKFAGDFVLKFGPLILVLVTAIELFKELQRIFSYDWENEGAKIVAVIGTIVAAIGALVLAIGMLTKNVKMILAGTAIMSGGLLTDMVAWSTEPEKADRTKLATGGIVTGPTKALVGEGKYNEAVIPLGASAEFSSMKNDIASAVVAGLASAGGSTTGNINITVNVDEDYIYKAYNRQKALRGGV